MITQAAWSEYIRKLANIDHKAADLVRIYIEKNGIADTEALIQYSYAVATKYGEASATLACEMYDLIADLMNAGVLEAIPAQTATLTEVAKGVTWAKYHSPSQIPGIVGRQVRQAGADTMIQNAIRDNAEWAWVPQGDTCAFCIMLASKGWVKASKAVLRGEHAEHIHQNCDCTFAISFKPKDRSQYDLIYDSDKYRQIYDNATDHDGNGMNAVNYIRRQQYAADPEKYREQKRDAYQAKQLEKDLNDNSTH